MPDKPDITIFEVGPRDGLQNEAQHVGLNDRLKLVELLIDSGLKAIEVGSFVSPKAVPQMADTEALIDLLPRPEGVRYSTLVPNLKGMEKAMQAQVHEVAIFASASQSFSQHNIACSIEESFERFAPVMAKAKAVNMPVRGYLSCAFGCPYEGEIAVDAVVMVARKLIELGCYEVAVSDTIGIATPQTTQVVMRSVIDEIGAAVAAAHFHDTHARALDNIKACLELDVTTFDSAVAGLGGCPYAPGATGNVATESVVDMLAKLGLRTGVDIAKVNVAAAYISKVLKPSSAL
ncbi:hydroxymethylglutaryl-CoA lyase [Ahrensia kielensis]|uniref:Hydroxymethylglutaryl-CoA lyase n=1 Tax=Ahrensia kielensis TaxID=76980 RepID=A0ABU9TAK2_9HYPH